MCIIEMDSESAEEKNLDLLQQHPSLLPKHSSAPSRENALHIAAADGDGDSVTELLRENPDVAKDNESAEKKFLDLLQQLPSLLTKLSSATSRKNALHIAAADKKKASTVTELLRENSDLAEDLDSQKSSPLHIAAAKGHKEIAKILLEKAPQMCWSRDYRGMNPVHVAAVNGHDGVLEELVKVHPFAAMETLSRGETALHLCVKHHKLKCLEVLVNLEEFIHAEDRDGETLLHWAVRYQDVEIVKYLMKIDGIDEKLKNSKGQSALKILKQSPSYKQHTATSMQIEESLKSRSTIKSMMQKLGNPPKEDLSSTSNSIMVVAVLIATMAFQAAVSPPGGVWQDDTPPHKAGESVMAFNHPKAYRHFMRSNTVAFVTSLTTILLLISGLPYKYTFFVWTLTVIMWMSVTAVGVTYAASLMVVTPKNQRRMLSHVVELGIIVWSGVMVILLVFNTFRLVRHWWKNLRDWMKIQYRSFHPPPPPSV